MKICTYKSCRSGVNCEIAPNGIECVNPVEQCVCRETITDKVLAQTIRDFNKRAVECLNTYNGLTGFIKRTLAANQDSIIKG